MVDAMLTGPVLDRVADAMAGAASHYPARHWLAFAEHGLREILREPGPEMIEAVRAASPHPLSADEAAAILRAAIKTALPKS